MEMINVEQIMEEIREEIKKKGYKESDLSFQDIPIKEDIAEVEQYDEQKLQELLHLVNTSTRVDYYKPIIGKGPKAIIKKAIRKIMKPLLLPLCQEQEQYNSSAVQVINQMYLYIELQEKRIDDLETIILKEK